MTGQRCEKAVGLMCPMHGDEHWRRFQPVVRPRGVLTPQQEARLGVAQAKSERAREGFKRAVVETLAEGASFSEVSRNTGLSTHTLQRWKREAWQTPCTCQTPSEKLYGDTNGWHCQTCNGLVK